MTLRTFYRGALLVPLVGLSLAFVLDRIVGPPDLTPGHALLPDSLTRGLIAYGVLTPWLWIQLGRRPEGELRRLVWRVPLLYVLVGGVLLLGFAAARGWLGALWPEHGGVLALRTLAHLAMGYGYVALVHLALARLLVSGAVQAPVARPS